jgi:hypothetical protein
MTSPAPQLISDTDLALSLDPAQTVPSELQPARGGAILAILPGLLLAAVVAISGYLLRSLPGTPTFSPMILAILLGTAFHNLVGTRQSPGRGSPSASGDCCASPSSCSGFN